MGTSQIYLVITIIALAVVIGLVTLSGRSKKASRLTPLTGLAFGFILAGILFGETRWLGFSLMGIGVILALVEIFKRARPK